MQRHMFAFFISKEATKFYLHPKDWRVSTPVLELTPLALVQSFFTCTPSKIALVKSAPVMSTLSKVERNIIASVNTASLKSAFLNLAKIGYTFTKIYTMQIYSLQHSTVKHAAT